MKRPSASGWLLAMGLASRVVAAAATLSEDFQADPTGRGWQSVGASAPAHWDTNGGRLRFQWDSAEANRYFLWNLPRALGRDDDFGFGFDFTLIEHAVGTTPKRPSTFPIAAGFLNVADATRADFVRGSGTGSPNLVEWAWFGADPTISASVSPIITSTNRPPRWAFRDSYVELEVGVPYRLEARFVAATSRLELWMEANGVPGPVLEPVRLPAAFTDFRVDAFGFFSYSDAGQDPRFAGSVRAEAWIDNVVITWPSPPLTQIQWLNDGTRRGVRFQSSTGWQYRLEGSADLNVWEAIGTAVVGTAAELTLWDSENFSDPQRFFRVGAEHL